MILLCYKLCNAYDYNYVITQCRKKETISLNYLNRFHLELKEELQKKYELARKES